MSQAKDMDFHKGPFVGGITWYPYQIAIGVSLRYWPCIFAPTIRIHIGPIKIWLAIILGGKDDKNVSNNKNRNHCR